MKINPKIYEELEKASLSADDVIPYLMCLYFNLRPSYMPVQLRTRVKALTKIYASLDGTITWTIPLFEGGKSDSADAWLWVVNEYCQLFTKVGHKPYARECLVRMKKLFSENPTIRKADVMNATKEYLESTNPKYVMYPHYFIHKGKGTEKTNNLLNWISSHQEKREQSQNRTRVTNKLQ